MDSYTPYKQIPNDYKIAPIFPNIELDGVEEGSFDYNSISVFKKLYDNWNLTNRAIKEEDSKIILENEHLYNGNEYSNTLYMYLASEYMDSAMALAKLVLEERKKIKTDGAFLSSYANPCAFLCRHAIELKFKQCLAKQGTLDTKHHNLTDLWEKIDKNKLDSDTITQLTNFIGEISEIDPNGESIRYGTDKQALPIKEKTDYDCIALVVNSMYLFNQLHKIAF